MRENKPFQIILISKDEEPLQYIIDNVRKYDKQLKVHFALNYLDSLKYSSEEDTFNIIVFLMSKKEYVGLELLERFRVVKNNHLPNFRVLAFQTDYAELTKELNEETETYLKENFDFFKDKSVFQFFDHNYENNYTY